MVVNGLWCWAPKGALHVFNVQVGYLLKQQEADGQNFIVVSLFCIDAFPDLSDKEDGT
ncbi:hypothetical protein Dimus_024614 [Dionaea muscipula]